MDQKMKQKLDTWRKAVLNILLDDTFLGEPGYLYEPAHYALSNQGKMLRSALCFATTEALGGRWQDAIRVATALEIFHTFTLVHDDIMDGDDLRRGKPTVHKQFGNTRALISGDAILIRAYQILSDGEISRLSAVLKLFNRGAMEVCEGQGWDMQSENSETVDDSYYQKMIDLKTGALLRLSCELGATVAGGSEAQVKTLGRYGLLLGRAFQMQDDLLEVVSSSESMGKSLGSDVLNGKKTWLWMDMWKHLTESDVAQWKKIQASGELREADRQTVQQWMETYGTLDRARALIRSWIDQAEELLKVAEVQNDYLLREFSTMILNREK